MKYSIVITVYNEEQSVELLYFSLKDVMDKINGSCEIIFVDDCSIDKSLEKLRNIRLGSSNLTIITLKKRCGQSTAMQAGFKVAKGELIITMDADLQNDPKDIPKLLEKMKGGYDLVCGWRYNRRDPWSKVFISKVICVSRCIITKENIHDFGCSLRVFKKEVLKHIYFSKSIHILLPLMMFKLGFKIGEVKVMHHPRRFGISKYNVLNRLVFIKDFMLSMLFFLFNLREPAADVEVSSS